MKTVLTYVLLLVTAWSSFSQDSLDLTPKLVTIDGNLYYAWQEPQAQFIAGELQHSKDFDAYQNKCEKNIEHLMMELSQKDETIDIQSGKLSNNELMLANQASQLEKTEEIAEKYRKKAQKWKMGAGIGVALAWFFALIK